MSAVSFVNSVQHDLAELVARCIDGDARAGEIVLDILGKEAAEAEPQLLVTAPRKRGATP